MDGLFFCDDVVHEMLSIGRISESRRRICHLNDAIQKYISLRVTLGLPSIFAWQARMRSLGLPFAISQLHATFAHLKFL